MSLNIKLYKIPLKNPLILASGFLGVTASSMINVINNGCAAATTKSTGLEERKGHPSPVILVYDAGMMNAVGLSNPGVKNTVKEIKDYKARCKEPIIASIFASTVKDFGKITKEISKANPDLIEVNISCPNVEDEFGKPFSTDAKLAAQVTKTVKNNASAPIIVKLSPNVSNIAAIAKAAEKAGANIINAINTVGPGMVIDIEAKKPILSNKVGGLSGPAIKPIAVKSVYDIYENVKVPIIGTGGITYGKDAIEFIMAGATALSLGTAIYYRGLDVFNKINREIKQFMKKNNYKSLEEIRGIAHV